MLNKSGGGDKNIFREEFYPKKCIENHFKGVRNKNMNFFGLMIIALFKKLSGTFN